MANNTFINGFGFTRKGILLFITLLFLSSSFAQKNAGTIKGVIVDSASHQPVANASVSVINTTDSAVSSFVISADKGNFEIKNLADGSYTLLISYEGLETLKKSFSIAAQQKTIDFGIINMQQAYKILKEVVVNNQVPVKVNGDTVAYNANAFKTKPNATVEDLLKKLPGVQVDRDGNVKAQGQEVQKIYVDGKEFFGNNPQVATKNLTADMIDQVQVYNDESDQAKFNGIDDGSRIKTINLKLKKDKKSGTFGKVYAGYGTDDRYGAGLNAYHFKGASQISLIAGSNNINNTGYSLTNLSGNLNNSGSGISSNSSGITKTSLYGINYRDVWGKHVDVTASYIANHTNTTNVRTSVKQTLLTDSNLLTNRSTIYNTIADNHTFNAKVLYTIDSFNTIIYSGSFNAQHTVSFNNDTLTDVIDKNKQAYKADDSRTINNNNSDLNTWANNLIWQRKFNRSGRTLSANVSYALMSGNRTGYSTINSRFYSNTGQIYHDINTNYSTSSNNRTNNYAVTLSYTEPIGTNKFLELNVSRTNNKNTSDIKTYNYNDSTKQYDNLIDSLTNNFDNINTFNRVGTNLKWVNKKYSYQLGLSLQETSLENNDVSEKNHQAQHYVNLLPTALLNYQISKNKNLQISYRGSNRPPAISQLQNITDISSYPYIRKGNPDLKQEFINNLVLSYNSFDITTLQNFFVYINYNSISNKIVNAIEQKAGEQISMPVNCNGAFNASGTINYGIPLTKTESNNLNTTTDIAYNRDVNIINNQRNYIGNLSLGEEINLNYNFKDKLDFSVNASVEYNSINYSIQKDQNFSFFTHNLSVDATYTLPHRFILSTAGNYRYYTEKSNGYNQHCIIWNASISKQLFKNNRGELKLSVNDILNNNVNFTRNVYDNYIEDVQNNVLKRFGLLTFTYNLNNMNAGKHAAKEEKP